MNAPRTARIDTLESGRLVEVRPHGDAGPSYFAYRPRSADAGRPLLVFVHGYARRAEDHARTLLPLCERLGCTLLAPHFTRRDQPRYQRLGRGRDGQRADRVLGDCIEDLVGHDAPAVWLSGFSGGAQFAHRYAMAHPERVARLIAIAAGWYTLPDPVQRYPYGLRTQRTLRGYSLNPERFLRVPTTVIVGAEDTGNHNLRQSAELDASQGRTRVERARNWVAHMRVAAHLHRRSVDIAYIEVPGIGHDFEEFVEQGRLLELLASALVGDHADVCAITDQRADIPARFAAPREVVQHVCA